jgi:hypothetical protein
VVLEGFGKTGGLETEEVYIMDWIGSGGVSEIVYTGWDGVWGVIPFAS